MMGKLADNLREYRRRYIQLITAVLYNCNLPGFVRGTISKGPLKGVCVPGLNCYSCPGAVASCPLGSLQYALSSSSYRLPLYVLGTLLLFGVLIGRVICGFLCPFGLIQELLYKIPLPKIKKNRVTAVLSYLKYVILAVFVIAIPIVRLVPGFCKYICPAGTLEAGIPLVAMSEMLQSKAGYLFSWKVFILALCILICMVCFRAFCRFICPLGAIYSFFNPIAFFGIHVDPGKCVGCNACISRCLMDTKHVGDHECIHCGECRKACKYNAISYGNSFGDKSCASDR